MTKKSDMRQTLRYLLLVLLWLTALQSPAQIYENPKSLPDPMRGTRRGYVCDPDGLLTPGQRNELDTRLTALERQGTVEMAVVLVNSIGDADAVEYAVELGTLWGVGKESNSNGVVLLVAMESHDIALQAGYGVEGVLPDIVCNDIINNDMVPLMRRDNLYGAVSAAVSAVTRIVSDPAVAGEVRGQAADRLGRKAQENREKLAFFAMLFCGGMFLVAVIYYLRVSRTSRRLGDDWYGRSRTWRKSLVPMSVMGVLSGGSGLVFALLALWRYRYWRTRRRKCHRCGARMRRLGEDEDNAYLNPSQDCEEKLGTVDYDVWLCPECGEVERYAYASAQNKYTPCPSCGAIAYGTQYERVLREPTARAAGKGQRVKVCRNCGYTDTEDFDIPRREDSSGALLAGAALGALASRGGGGGSFGGGGWGGGSFGGGGASGKW